MPTLAQTLAQVTTTGAALRRGRQRVVTLQGAVDAALIDLKTLEEAHRVARQAHEEAIIAAVEAEP